MKEDDTSKHRADNERGILNIPINENSAETMEINQNSYDHNISIDASKMRRTDPNSNAVSAPGTIQKDRYGEEGGGEPWSPFQLDSPETGMYYCYCCLSAGLLLSYISS